MGRLFTFRTTKKRKLKPVSLIGFFKRKKAKAKKIRAEINKEKRMQEKVFNEFIADERRRTKVVFNDPLRRRKRR